VTAFKDLFEDLKKHSSDNEENNKKILVLNKEGVFEETIWKKI
jgi:hypothetical protein